LFGRGRSGLPPARVKAKGQAGRHGGGRAIHELEVDVRFSGIARVAALGNLAVCLDALADGDLDRVPAQVVRSLAHWQDRRTQVFRVARAWTSRLRTGDPGPQVKEHPEARGSAKPEQACARRGFQAGRRSSLPDIVELICADHLRISQLIEKLNGALAVSRPPGPGYEPELIWGVLDDVLSLHVQIAEEIAYQALTKADPGARPALRQSSEADADIRAAIQEARLARSTSRSWGLAVRAACNAARDHIACVEPGALVRYRWQAAPTARDALGHQWVAFVNARVLDAADGLPR
jgi:hypothetical protein